MKHILLTVGFLFILCTASLAADTTPSVTGTWHWSGAANADGQVPKVAFHLVAEAGVVTGTVIKANSTHSITNGILKGDQVKFQVISLGHAGWTTATYSGTVTGNVIKGKVEIDVADKHFSTEWEAKRE